ncbi:MAG: DUF488 domain-containing protein [Tropicimonas sp.]|uniref:DUF488 domain-containing protein n=1 Tax=Tropicimonas sp. TaxID=2067044 RepID=UPI003A8AD9B7
MSAEPPLPDSPAGCIRIGRIYRPAQASDGRRILVDRLWPRGMTKARAGLFAWCREIAPSTELRHWFHSSSGQWEAFVSRYEAELAAHEDLVRELAGYAREGVVTLLHASRDETRNNAIVLRDYLRHRLQREEAAHDQPGA